MAVIEHPFRGDARGSVAVVNRKGERRRLSGDFSTIGSASWSPRGDEIWFSAAAASEGMAVYAVNLSGRQRIVSRGPGSQSVEDVSSEGRVLLSHWHVRMILMVFTPAQTRERDLSWLDGSRPFDFSDDGKTIYFTELGEGAGSPADSVWKRETDGAPAVRLGEGLGAGVSPDGKWVLALRFHQQPAQLFLIPTGAGEEKALTHDRINHRAAAWFPDGRRVLFIGDEPGKGPRLYVQSIEGGPPRAITEEAARGTTWATWRPISPDGRWTVWFDGEYGLYPTDGGKPRPIPGLAAGEIPIGWSSDGRALYVRDRRRTPIKAFLLDVSTGKRQSWKEIGAPVADVEFVATPDGNSYAYSYRSSSSDLYLVEGLK